MKVCDMMGWNPQYRYKVLGKLVRANDELIFLFDLTSQEAFERTFNEDGKRSSSRTPVFPVEWKNQFGIPFSEHKKALQINMFEGYTVFSLADRSKEKNEGKGDHENGESAGQPDQYGD